MSSRGGQILALDRIQAIGGTCLQIFSGSPRTWKRSPIESFPAEDFFLRRKELSIDPVFVHALYLVNLVSDNEDTRRKSSASLAYDLKFNSLIGGAGVVVHLGSHQGKGWVAVQRELLQTLARLLEDAPSESQLLIENSAGQKGKLCSDFQEIRWLIDQLQDRRVRWCFDTCHAFAAGYSLGKGTVNRTGLSAEQAISDTGLWEYLDCIHVNDSRDPFGSGRDRHANISEGLIPAEDLSYFLTLDQCLPLPLILEVPGKDDQGPDAENVLRLQKLLE